MQPPQRALARETSHGSSPRPRRGCRPRRVDRQRVHRKALVAYLSPRSRRLARVRGRPRQRGTWRDRRERARGAVGRQLVPGLVELGSRSTRRREGTAILSRTVRIGRSAPAQRPNPPCRSKHVLVRTTCGSTVRRLRHGLLAGPNDPLRLFQQQVTLLPVGALLDDPGQHLELANQHRGHAAASLAIFSNDRSISRS